VGRDQELVICSVSTGAKFMNRDLTFTAEMAGAQCAIVESEVLVRGLREALARTTEVVAVTQQLLWDSGEILRAAKDCGFRGKANSDSGVNAKSVPG
jgi:hypothetical protein